MLGGIAPPQSTIDGDVDRVLQERTVVLICSFSTKREESRFSIETLQREREKKKEKKKRRKKKKKRGEKKKQLIQMSIRMKTEKEEKKRYK